MMRTSARGIKEIKSHEGLRLFSYKDIADVWTIGYGHTKGVTGGQHISQETADAFLLEDLVEVEEAIARHVNVPLTQGQYDALASFIFNLGPTRFRESTLLEKLNARNYTGAADELLRWNKAHVDGQLREVEGLTARRQRERAMFMEGQPPKAEPTSSEFMMPIPAIVSAILPSVIQLIPQLGKIFGSGSEVSERNIAAATSVVDVVTKATGAINAQDAVEKMKADPVLVTAATKAVESIWFELAEGGGGGIAGARKAEAAAMSAEGAWWSFVRSPSFWTMLLLIPLVYLIVLSMIGVLGPVQWSDEVRSQTAGFITGTIVGGLMGYYFGQVTSRNRSAAD